MIAEFSIVPVGKGESISAYVAECIKLVEASGLDHRLCPMGTVVEGEYDEVMELIGACHKRVMELCGRAVTTIKIDDRKGAKGTIEGKIRSVEERLGREVKR